MLIGSVDSQLNIGGNTYPLTVPTLNLNFARSKAVDPRITFTRNSPASYTDEDGYIKYVANNVPRIDFDPVTNDCNGLLIEEQRTNLFLRSEDYSNTTTWFTSDASIIPATGIIAPDGTYTASKLVDTPSTGLHYITQTVSVTANITYTHSVYVKAGEIPSIGVYQNGGSNGAKYNISTGTLIVNDANISSTLVACNNGWYRVSSTFMYTTGGSKNINLYLMRELKVQLL